MLNGWLHRAERLLQGAPEQPVHGLLAVVRGMTAFTGGDLDTAAVAGRRALELGTSFGIPDLQAMGLHLEGRAPVTKGRVEEGMALLDEATAAAVSGQLSPQVTGRVYCSTVSACWGVADYRRAVEWADAAERWCQRRSINGSPGSVGSTGPRSTSSGIRRGSFEAPPNSDLQRASLLPAQVEIGLAVEDLNRAGAAAAELERIAGTCGVTAMQASAAWARGSVQLGQGQAEAAQQSFRRSASLWAELDAPYETARARLGLADAYRAGGNEAERCGSTGPPWPTATRSSPPPGPPPSPLPNRSQDSARSPSRASPTRSRSSPSSGADIGLRACCPGWRQLHQSAVQLGLARSG